MSGVSRASAADRIDAATPASRDRYVDFLRVFSLGTVIVGHWLMAVVVVGREGNVTTTNALALMPALQPLTWVLQVMPVFFLVGGYANARAWESLRRHGGTYADFVRTRAGRLLRPTAAFAGAWVLTALLLEWLGLDTGVVVQAARIVAQPLWFVGVYLGVAALAPLMLRQHRRHGAAVLTVLIGLVALVDVLRFGYAVPYVGYLNVAFVWLAVHQVGFFWADGTLVRRQRVLAPALAGVGLGGVIALTAYGPYPVSMVGLPGEPVSNMSPPTFALACQAAFVIGVALLLRGPLGRWLQRPRPWAVVVTANGWAMTAFLWHLTALFAVVAVALALGLPHMAVGDWQWWATRPVVLGLLALVTAGLVAIFRTADRPRPARIGAQATSSVAVVRDALAAGGVGLSVVGILGLSMVGFGGALSGRMATLVVLPVSAVSSLALIAAGSVLLVLSRPTGASDRPVPPPLPGPASHQ